MMSLACMVPAPAGRSALVLVLGLLASLLPACGLVDSETESAGDASPQRPDVVVLDARATHTDASARDAADAGEARDARVDAADASGDDLLKSLSISLGSLTPYFTPMTTQYIATVDPMLLSPSGGLTLTATADDPHASITVNGAPSVSGMASGAIAVASPPGPIEVVVTATNGDTKTYTVSLVVPTLSMGGAELVPSGASIPYNFGWSLALDGDTLVIGAPGDSDALGDGTTGETPPGTPADAGPPPTAPTQSGAVYVFTRSGSTWSQSAVLQASNSSLGDGFGAGVAIVGTTIVVGAPGESSPATGVNGGETGTGAYSSGAAYVFTGGGASWTQVAYLKAAVNAPWSSFGNAIAMTTSPSGTLLLGVGAPNEQSAATGINGDASDTSADGAGAAYVFSGSGSTWTQEAYLKASNTRPYASFGATLAFSGTTLAVAAPDDWSGAEGVDGNASDFPAPEDWWNYLGPDAGLTAVGATPLTAVLVGGVYVFVGDGASPESWSEQAYIKGTVAQFQGWGGTGFGFSLALDRDTLVVGAPTSIAEDEAIPAYLDGGTPNDASTPGSDLAVSNGGEVAVYMRTQGAWALSYTVAAVLSDMPAFNPDAGAGASVYGPLAPTAFGSSVAVNGGRFYGASSCLGLSGAGAQSSAVTGYSLLPDAGWTEANILTPTTNFGGLGGWGPFAGGAMALSGDTLALSTGEADHAQAVYIYAVP